MNTADPGVVEEWKFNSSLDGNTRRAIDFHEGDTVEEAAFKALVRAVIAINRS